MSASERVQMTSNSVGNAAVFLAADEARDVTGVILPVDGSMTVRGPGR